MAECLDVSTKSDYMVNDKEIKALANLSCMSKGVIEEFKSSDGYNMVLKTYNNNGTQSERILIFSENGNKYKEASKHFFEKFIHYKGDVILVPISSTNNAAN